MPGLILHKSNRMEALAEALADTLRSPLESPLAAETVVVQSLGMRRWLSLQLAEKHGICANCKFPFPKAFVDDVFAAFLPRSERNFFTDRTALAWRVMKILPGLVSHPEFAPVKNYISGHSSDLKLFQLSEKIASVFDQYIVFRPQMILAWERGGETDWQASLWRELVKGTDVQHQAAQGRELSRLLKNVEPPSRKGRQRVPVGEDQGEFSFAPADSMPAVPLPQRVSVFGISSLPPFYVQLFGALASKIDIHFFLLDPTDQLWAHIISDAEEDKIRRKLKNSKLDAEALHAHEKNSLLASFGKTGRDFQDLILELEPTETKEYYVEPTEGAADFQSAEDEPPSPSRREVSSTLLAALQADIFNLSDPAEKHLVSPNDRSIQIHSCHSPMREMEVLHDQLLALFEDDPSLLPKDIVVMMPDVKTYAPFIEAVFGSTESSDKHIPFTIADRGLRRENSLADSLLKILALCRGRFGVGSVLEILESPAVKNAFHLSESNLETIRGWMENAGIRWAIDAAHRENLGLPALEQNTWRFGLKRLLLGYALPARGEKLFEGILPYDEIEGDGAETLGNFIDFVEKLFALGEEFEKPRALAEWQKLFHQLLDDFFAPDEEFESELYILRKSMASLKNLADVSEFDREVSADVIVAHLKRLLENDESTSGFIMGGVTFCALRPMRSVPFQVVCLTGMSDTSFPRPQKVLGFDKMTEKPQIGDRSNRHEDRYLFLEAILSARNFFYISYVGQSIRDNAALPPSVLVSELLDYLERGYELSPTHHASRITHTPATTIQDHVVTKHRLQPFSPSYFGTDEKLWSYSAENCTASRVTLRPRQAPSVFISQKLPEPEAEWHTVELDALAKFFSNPAEFFLRHRLGVNLGNYQSPLDEREIVEVDPLTQYKLKNFFAEKSLAGFADETAFALLTASGNAPMGKIGDCQARQYSEEIKKFATTVQQLSSGPLPDIPIQQKIGPWEIAGTLRGLYPKFLLRSRCAETKPKDILGVWIQHLALNLIRPGSTSIFIGLDDKVTFQPVVECETVLQRLLEIYWDGLRDPLRFFPKTSFTFAKRKFQPGNRQKSSPRGAAEKEWWGNDYESQGECENAYFKLCFGSMKNPLDETWEKLTEEICAPILQNTKEETL